MFRVSKCAILKAVSTTTGDDLAGFSRYIWGHEGLGELPLGPFLAWQGLTWKGRPWPPPLSTPQGGAGETSSRIGQTFAGDVSSVGIAKSTVTFTSSKLQHSEGPLPRCPHHPLRPSASPQTLLKLIPARPTFSNPDTAWSLSPPGGWLLTALQSPWAARLKTVPSDLSSPLCSAGVHAAQVPPPSCSRHLDIYLLSPYPVPGSGACLLVPHLPPALNLPAAPGFRTTFRCSPGQPCLSSFCPRTARQAPSAALAESSPPLPGLQPPLK